MARSRCIEVSFCILFALLAGWQPASAQNTIPSPTPVRPLTNGVPNVPGSDALSLGDGARFAVTHVQGATHYVICVSAPGVPQCLNGNTPIPVTARVNASVPINPSNPIIEFFTTIPPDRQGTFVEWRAQACTGPSGPCGNFSTPQSVIVLLPQATLSANNSPILPNNRSVTFQWTNNPLANEGAQLIVLPEGLPQNIATLFRMNNPTLANAPGLSIPINTGVNTHTMTIPNELGPAVKWTVATCRNFAGKGRRCSQILTSWKSMRIANFFSTVIVPTMLHPRCVNCHLAPPNGFPPGHRTASNTCGTCHDATKPAEGNINLEWHAPPSNMNFARGQNESVPQHILRLCSMAKLNGNGFQHLTQDKLILWAVKGVANGNVAVPAGGAALPAAPPGNVQTWQNHVFSWWFHTQRACD